MPTRALPAAETTPPAPTRSATHRFPRHRRSVGRVRAALREQLAIWQLDAAELADCATLLVSELATNAVNAKAAPGREIGVRFELSGPELLIEVSGAGDGWPELKHPKGDDESGRGLALVDTLAADWGVNPRGGIGKTVWALLVLPAGAVS
ncbi:putative anti-sigma regulatory factor, serine/threonine protein kinase [Actinobacteria bacterium OK074]|nr:putative anti-sigma regulatory factor, serine/threonine protein kinase [Actinobacteria bacterium OK074]